LQNHRNKGGLFATPSIHAWKNVLELHLSDRITKNKWFLCSARMMGWLLAVPAMLIVLYLVSRSNYLFFHAIVEFFSIVVACGVFMIAWNSRRFHENGFLLWLGVASLFVAGVDFLHTLAFKKMGVFPEAGANLPTQLWIVARYLEGSSLLLATLFLRIRLRPAVLVGTHFAGTALLLGAVFGGFFPDCFREGAGLTSFKIGSEYVICTLLAGSIFLLYRNRQAFSPRILRLLTLAVGAFILAELSFTLYTDVFGFSNMAGHLFKVAGFYLIYRGVIETGLTCPYDLLFRELKQSEEVLRQRTFDLEEANVELETANNQLAVANNSLELANCDLEAFNYSVSHDLRGHLAAISARCQLIQHLCADQVDPKGRELILGIDRQTMSMNALITTLLDFSCLSKVDLKRKPVDLSAMAQAIALELAASEPHRPVSFHIAEEVEAEADPDLLKVLLENLLGNAWKFTAAVAEGRIEVGRVETAGSLAYFVRDNGVGFDPACAADLFVPFKRLQGAEKFKGFGIGLATVKRIVERHGGRVWADSLPGEGATFFFSM
jgi:signal transduction histidine kinase